MPSSCRGRCERGPAYSPPSGAASTAATIAAPCGSMSANALRVVLIAAALVAAAPAHAAAPAGAVDPLIGTGRGRTGATFPGAVVPFGAVQFSPVSARGGA